MHFYRPSKVSGKLGTLALWKVGKKWGPPLSNFSQIIFYRAAHVYSDTDK